MRSHARLTGIGRSAASCVLTVLLASGIALGPLSSTGVGEAGTTPRPNVLLIVTDDQRADWANGHLLRTTNLRARVMPNTESALASEGVTFRNAFVTNPACCPSRASILTGTYSHTSGVWSNDPPHGGFAAFGDSSTIATWLDEAGYRTGFFGTYLNGYPAAAPYVPPGWDRWFAHVRPGYLDYSFNDDGRIVESDGRWAPTVMADEAIDFVGASGRPFFAMVAPYLPHKGLGPGGVPEPNSGDEARFASEPGYRVPSYNERRVKDKPRWVRRTPAWSRERSAKVDTFRLLQYRTLFGWDREVGRILSAVEATGELGDTLIIFTSDNGYMWGEHRLVGKSKPYDTSVRVPFLMRYDAKPLIATVRGVVVNDIALNIDIAPTIAQSAGARVPRWVDGVNLVGVLRGSVDRRSFAIEHVDGGGAPAFCAVRTASRLFVRYSTGEEEYYDYREDPWEELNRADRRGVRSELRRMRSSAKKTCDPTPPGFSW